jgi:hypothetical protein
VDKSKLKIGDRVQVSFIGTVSYVSASSEGVRVDVEDSGWCRSGTAYIGVGHITEVLPEPIKVGDRFQSKGHGDTVYEVLKVEGNTLVYATYLGGMLGIASTCNLDGFKGYTKLN